MRFIISGHRCGYADQTQPSHSYTAGALRDPIKSRSRAAQYDERTGSRIRHILRGIIYGCGVRGIGEAD